MKGLSSQNPIRIMTPPRQKWRMPFYKLVVGKGFELFIMGAIITNTVILALTITPDDGRAPILENINFYVFALLFCAEAVSIQAKRASIANGSTVVIVIVIFMT